MDLILCHTTVDFDALGAAVGLTRLQPGAKVVLAGGCHPAVRDFLALHRDEYELIERRSVNSKKIRSLTVVDTQRRDRLGKTAEWLDLPQLESITIYDHHPDTQSDIPATRTQIEPVGATTTLIVEELEKLSGLGTAKNAPSPFLTSAEATVMALGIHVDTGSLLFPHATPRDAAALAWLMQQGASLAAIANYADPGFSPQLQQLLTVALEKLQTQTMQGYKVSWVLLSTDRYVPGLSTLASQLLDLTEGDALLLANVYTQNSSQSPITIIGRSRIEGTNLNQIFQPLGGGGHSQAAALTLRGVNPQETLDRLVQQLQNQIPQPPTARELMSSPVRTIRPETTIDQANRILLRYGHSGLSVVNDQDQLVGIISRRDIDLALHHGFSHAPVKGYMSGNLKTITPEALLSEIESLMVTYDIGRLPVLEDGRLVGIVTRTDVLRQLHQEKEKGKNLEFPYSPVMQSMGELLPERLHPQLWELLAKASEEAEKRGWHLYLVGGVVRDLLLAEANQPVWLQDIDLVVDGFHRAANVGAGVELARELQKIYSAVRLEVHGQFQTAALLWHKDPVLGSLWVDIATARTEFYPYPAANPEVEASSIRQDLYRRDFTINALAVRLSQENGSSQSLFPLLDCFGGLLDLRSRQIRVLHANSFIEDPTRIYRAVRFAVRLGFQIEPQTERYIRYAIDSGIYKRSLLENSKAPALQTRLKSELKYILKAPYWQSALQLLGDLGALRCIHSTLELDEHLWWQLRLVEHCLQRFHPQKNLDDWQMRLEVLIAYLSPEYRGKVAANLQLPADSIERLEKLADCARGVVESLLLCQRPSQVVELLHRSDLPTLILIAVQSPRAVRRKIWQYLTKWANVQPLLNGHDLQALGYKPGREFKQILDALLAATLDGEISDRAGAETFLKLHF